MSLPACRAPFLTTDQNEPASPWVTMAKVRSRPWVAVTLSFPPPPPELLLSLLEPQPATTSAVTRATRAVRIQGARLRMSGNASLLLQSHGVEEVDALANIDDRTAAHRWLRTGDRGVLLEHEPALVPVPRQRAEDRLDPRIAGAERAEEPRLRRLHQRQLARPQAVRDGGVDVLEMHMHDALAVCFGELDGVDPRQQQMPGVQAPAHVARAEQPLDRVRTLEQGAPVGMHRELQAMRGGELRDLVEPRHEPRPLRVVERHGRRPGVVADERGDEHV